jgi:hypothetical protein
MIIRNEEDRFILIKQHDHGLLAGRIASNWGNEAFEKPTDELIFAASMHDISWHPYDEEVKWNNKRKEPYDFIHYPTSEKLLIYQEGLNTLEKSHPYSALLTSKHYCSFYKSRNEKDVHAFLQSELLRQERLQGKYTIEQVTSDLSLLKLYDDLSLYVCLNKPGVAKELEHPWYKNGIPIRAKQTKTTFHLHWINNETISIDPFPFKHSWSTVIPYRELLKEDSQSETSHIFQVTFVESCKKE